MISNWGAFLHADWYQSTDALYLASSVIRGLDDSSQAKGPALSRLGKNRSRTEPRLARCTERDVRLRRMTPDESAARSAV